MQFAVGEAVLVRRSDGSLRFGEIIGAAGWPWQQAWEVRARVSAIAPASRARGPLEPAASAALLGSDRPTVGR